MSQLKQGRRGTLSPTMRKVVLVATTGAMIEWYDFFIYATAAALVFPALFFPADMPVYVGVIASFSTLAVGMVARPFGAAIFGHLGDKYGRKKALVVALLMMGAASTLIGVLPTYAAAGVLAPIALTTLRMFQGLAVGGQWGGAILLITENAPSHRKGYYGGFAQAGVPAGVVASNAAFLLVAALMPHEAFMSWGWRVPFLLSVVMIAVGVYAQARLEESPAFAQLQSTATKPTRSPALQVLRSNPKQILLGGAAFAAYIGYFYVLVSYVVQYATAVLHVAQTTVLAGVLAGAALQIFSIMIAARLSDRFGRRKVFAVGVALLALWAFPCFLLIDTGSAFGIFTALIVGQIFMGVPYGPQAALFAEMFKVGVRYSGASLAYQAGAIIGGAFAPVIATALFAATKTSMSVSAYLFALSLISLIAILLIKETLGSDVDAPAEPATDDPRATSAVVES
ncbi:MFS transporter [Paenarthrobacter sp. NPDC089316]|uniref:MFS transporter n=1 Tax=unclassified Paenarthrobacter TaxID=2634190 RepID=UPI00342E7132